MEPPEGLIYALLVTPGIRLSQQRGVIDTQPRSST
jgi:hypothetical protein